MPVLDQISMLLVRNTRSSAYLQHFLAAGHRPHRLLILDPKDGLFHGQRETDAQDQAGAVALPSGNATFDPDITVDQLITAFDIPSQTIASTDPNTPEVCSAVHELPGTYLVYSGPGGAILKELLGCGKQLIHIHSGSLPRYRGSTTMYYELLDTGRCAATAIFMAPRLDGGEVLHAESFPPPDGVDIDFVYDADCRGRALAALIEEFVKHGSFKPRAQEQIVENPYYIMHPTLRQVVKTNCEIEREPGAAEQIEELLR